MRRITMVIVALVLLTVASSAFAQPRLVAKLTGIERVLMHQPQHFSFLVVGSDGIGRMVEYNFAYYPIDITFIFDVPGDRAMWLESNITYSFFGRVNASWMKIHLRTYDDINGAGWTRRSGKTTRHGMTTVVR